MSECSLFLHLSHGSVKDAFQFRVSVWSSQCAIVHVCVMVALRVCFVVAQRVCVCRWLFACVSVRCQTVCICVCVRGGRFENDCSGDWLKLLWGYDCFLACV